jgi:hypothetical protein
MKPSSAPAILQWIQSTNLSIAIREGGLPYPVIGLLHLWSIAMFGGMLLVSDLRLLGWAMQRRLVSDVFNGLRAWKRLGFIVITVTGVLLWWCEPIKMYHSPSFWTKMVLFVLVGVHALVFRKDVYLHPEQLDGAVTPKAKFAAVLSLLLWAGLIVSGRLIAFDE